jgi:hypothetical protein
LRHPPLLLRFCVLHTSGVLRYYEQAWAPGNTQSPKRSLLVRAVDAVECRDDISAGDVKWPTEADMTRRLAIVFPGRSYVL